MRGYYQRKEVPERMGGNGIHNTGGAMSLREGRDIDCVAIGGRKVKDGSRHIWRIWLWGNEEVCI